jgi:hypothetical protein
VVTQEAICKPFYPGHAPGCPDHAPTHDTPEAALERALERTEKSGYPGRAEWAAAVVGNLDGWLLVPTGSALAEENARLRAALVDCETWFADQHTYSGGDWLLNEIRAALDPKP